MTNVKIYAWAFNRKREWVKYNGILIDDDGSAYVDTRYMGLQPLKPPYDVMIEIESEENKCCAIRSIGEFNE